MLRLVGARDQVSVLLARDPAAHAVLDAPGGVGLLRALRLVGARDQVAVLAARDPAAHAVLDDPGGVAGLAHSKRHSSSASTPRRQRN
jgi:hypothetical protein